MCATAPYVIGFLIELKLTRELQLSEINIGYLDIIYKHLEIISILYFFI